MPHTPVPDVRAHLAAKRPPDKVAKVELGNLECDEVKHLRIRSKEIDEICETL